MLDQNRCACFFQAQRHDELSIVQDEEIEIIEWDDGDGWCKGRNKAGSEGFLPHSYIQARANGISRSTSPHTVNTMNGGDENQQEKPLAKRTTSVDSFESELGQYE